MKILYFFPFLALFVTFACEIGLDTQLADEDDPQFDDTESVSDDIPDTDTGSTSDPGELCGNGLCDDMEDCSSCPEDCSDCATCGDEICQADEDCQSCLDDCGECDTATTGDDDAYARIVSPKNGSVFEAGESIAIKTDTYSPHGVGIVRFWVNDGDTSQVFFEDPDPPFETNWTPSSGGSYKLSVRAKDGSGELIDSEQVAITVEGDVDHIDLCPDDPNKTDPGKCGCGQAEGTCDNPDDCPKGAATTDNRSHHCTYHPGGSPKGNLRMKYPGGQWVSVGCKNGKPVADNSDTQWKMEGRQLHVVGASLKLKCAELDHPCTCGSGAENFHGMSPDYKSANALGNAINYPGGGWIFNNNGHETCLGIHKQGKPGEIESIWSRPKGSHNHDWPGHSHKECPIFCLGEACP